MRKIVVILQNSQINNIENVLLNIFHCQGIVVYPLWALYILSDIMYYPLYYVIRYRRKIVRKNLTESFPEKSHEEIIAIEKSSTATSWT